MTMIRESHYYDGDLSAEWKGGTLVVSWDAFACGGAHFSLDRDEADRLAEVIGRVCPDCYANKIQANEDRARLQELILDWSSVTGCSSPQEFLELNGPTS